MEELIRLVAADQGSVSTGDITRRTGLTRQAVHYHLSRMLKAGQIERTGGGRGSRYFLTYQYFGSYPLPGLEEHVVWKEVIDSVPEIAAARDNVTGILTYGFTEMLNNAIDHSSGTFATVTFWTEGDELSFQVADDGIGVFRHVREKMSLENDISAIQELSKGKQTTAPERHTGEGIFFTSKVMDWFELDSGGLRWAIDNLRSDQAVGEAPEHRGTRVQCRIAKTSERTVSEVFDAYTREGTLEFDRSSTALRLFETSGRFVSRSEARRLSSNLERFRELIIDFSGVSEVGQGFIDELFRVWAGQHPGTRLIPANMNPTVERMVRRGLSIGT